MSFAHRVSRLKHSRQVASIMLAAGASIAVVSGARGQGGPPLPIDARAQGSRTAPVTVYEMADFQCPYCRDFATATLPLLEKEYIRTGKVRWVFINLPIPSIHPNAVPAAEFAACAARQGKFWPTHNMLYATHDKWENLKNALPFFQAQMPSLGLKPDLMATCLQSGAGADVVKDDVAGAERSGAHSTPTFYIEGGMMAGAQPIEVFRQILDSIYAAKTGKR